MKLKKLFAAVAATAIALSMSVVNAFAATVTMNSDYAGAWALTAYIPKSELTAIGGDVKITLHVTPKAPDSGDVNSVLAPTDANWTRLTDKITSDTAVAKEDGMLVVNSTVAEDTVSFVFPASAVEALTDDGLTFQANDVIITSADLEAGAPEAALRTVNEEQAGLMIREGKTYEEATAPAEPAADAAPADATEADADADAAADEAEEAPADVEDEDEEITDPADEAEPADVTDEDEDAPAEPAAETEAAPAADSTTEAAGTGNVAIASIAAVMAVAGAAVVASRKRK